ncbi:MAG: hypothetical protein KatS3mg003_1743 [Candidatus Nitrosocaldaceae archaeon]|nr:MAG: hypothetical protein KatS3mg003_1743 [Candidatus Nitrosocaldaceae archaeon]
MSNIFDKDRLFRLANYNLDIPDSATLRYEYVYVNNKRYGPYLYAYYREGKKLKKRYLGKSYNDYLDRKLALDINVDIKFYKRFRIIKWLAEHGDKDMQLVLEALKFAKNDIAIKKVMSYCRDIIDLTIINRYESDEEFRKFLGV